MDKSPDAFRTISEVAEHLDTPAHVLRFWESRFPQIKPVKRAGGRRYYRPADVALLSGIKKLLHDDGLTIRGVQKILREQGVKHVSDLSDSVFIDPSEAEIALDVDEAMEPETVVSSDPIPLFPRPKTADPAAEPVAATDALPEADMAELSVPPEESRLNPDAPDDSAPDDSAAAAEAEPDDDNDGIDEAALMAALSDPVESTPAEVEEEAAQVQTVQMETVQAPDPEPELAAPRAEAPSPTDEAPQFAFDSGELSPDSDQEVEADSLPEALEQVETVAENAAKDELTDTKEPTPEAMPKPPLPDPMPPITEINGHWLPADLRALPRGALARKRDEAAALAARLEALRNRVGDLGRVPRR